VQVGALTNWSKISAGAYAGAAIKTDGTLWTWGGGALSTLGLGNGTSYSSPKQVGALTAWSNISARKYHMASVKTDGTLWTWGYGDGGGLGLETTTNRSSPVQVGALTTWLNVATGYSTTFAISN
jgi:alpha-tubulin suppressor-like RCC1 family protein